MADSALRLYYCLSQTLLDNSHETQVAQGYLAPQFK
jgi:hypothetical protein